MTSLGSRSGVNWIRAHRAVDRPGERLGQHGLADAGHVLDEQVALGEQHGDRRPDDVALALDDRLDARGDLAAPWRATSSRGAVPAAAGRVSVVIAPSSLTGRPWRDQKRAVGRHDRGLS